MLIDRRRNWLKALRQAGFDSSERDSASAYGQHHRYARSTNRIAVAPGSTSVVVVQRDVAQASGEKESRQSATKMSVFR
jgi:hypothetical protein